MSSACLRHNLKKHYSACIHSEKHKIRGRFHDRYNAIVTSNAHISFIMRLTLEFCFLHPIYLIPNDTLTVVIQSWKYYGHNRYY